MLLVVRADSGEKAMSWVVGDHGNHLVSGATFYFQGPSTTKWSVRSHRVYKHSFHECFFLPGLSHFSFVFIVFGINSLNIYNSCIFIVKFIVLHEYIVQ